ncbi:MAG: AmmeMemoRadiSam system protein A, partial [Actinomycetota bacterium]|nr:AmmeMemoRadiSam system protein A [Actinomycetota bacterium]
MLTDERRAALLRTAREAVDAAARGEQTPLPPGEGPPDASGVFVTIKRRGELRGCLGVLEMRASLEREVARCAYDSATRDPRFPALGEGELPDTSIDISVLGPLEEIDPSDPGAIIVGRHGLVVEQGTRRGLLLPQVAPEWGWTRDEFLRHTCRKAGLPLDAW